jgi:plasmid stabilization system protein ParE
LIVEWSATARDERHSLFDRLAAINPIAALELDDEIARKTEILPDHPELYRPVACAGRTKWCCGRTASWSIG